MRVLLDHCLPRRLRYSLAPHSVTTAADMGWDGLRNGELLAAAATQFDAFLTIDKRLKHDQNLGALPLPVIVIMAPTNRYEDVLPFVSGIVKALDALSGPAVIEVTLWGA